jgi:hypothetical protein
MFMNSAFFEFDESTGGEWRVMVCRSVFENPAGPPGRIPVTRGLARAIFCKAEVVQRMEHEERCQVSCPVSCDIPSMEVGH